MASTLMVGSVLAQEDAGRLLTDMPEASDDVIVNGYFPKNADLKFPLGEVVDVLFGVVNEGQDRINVTAVAGSLNSPYDFNYYMQNFTEVNYNTIIFEDGELSFRYQFKPIETIDLNVEYKVALTAFYESDEELFSSTFFNGTITFVEKTSEGDSGFFIYALALVAVIGILFTASQNVGSLKAMRSSGGASDDAWTTGIDEKGSGTTKKTQVKRRNGSKKAKRN